MGYDAGSRLRWPGGVLEKEPKRVAAHCARELGPAVLISNEGGSYALLSREDYARYLAGGIADEEDLGKDLIRKNFLRDRLDFKAMASRAVERGLLDRKGPVVHTVVVTLRCNFKCLYCHASVVDPSRLDKDMSLETAKQTVDLIFQSPSPSLMIEFQGGEPLLNWPVVKFIVEYARAKNRLQSRELHFGLISNFSLLDDEKLDWLAAAGVSFCTSLDGPEDLHNKNRVFLGGNSHGRSIAGLERIQARRKAGARIDPPNAICTVTRFSFGRHEEIVGQLLSLGLERAQFGPLDPMGFAARNWDKIGYGSAEFVEFYGQALDHLIRLNQAGVKVYEKMALIFLIRILEGGHWRFPNADAVGRLAYNYDGSVYTCEEGRLLANEGDDFFRIGHVAGSSYAELLDHPTVRASLLAGSPLAQPQCSQCAYSPYCTVLPVYNYRTQGSLWGHMPTNGWCETMMGLFDLIFAKLQDPAARAVLESWLEYKDR